VNVLAVQCRGLSAKRTFVWGQVLILADWIKSRVFGRDIAIYSMGDEGAPPVFVTVRFVQAAVHSACPRRASNSCSCGRGWLVGAAAEAHWVQPHARRFSVPPPTHDRSVILRRGGSQDAAVAGSVEHLSPTTTSHGHCLALCIRMGCAFLVKAMSHGSCGCLCRDGHGQGHGVCCRACCRAQHAARAQGGFPCLSA
jgi:hypothetical protein